MCADPPGRAQEPRNLLSYRPIRQKTSPQVQGGFEREAVVPPGFVIAGVLVYPLEVVDVQFVALAAAEECPVAVRGARNHDVVSLRRDGRRVAVVVDDRDGYGLPTVGRGREFVVAVRQDADAGVRGFERPADVVFPAKRLGLGYVVDSGVPVADTYEDACGGDVRGGQLVLLRPQGLNVADRRPGFDP